MSDLVDQIAKLEAKANQLKDQVSGLSQSFDSQSYSGHLNGGLDLEAWLVCTVI